MTDLASRARAGDLDPVYILSSDHPVLLDRVITAIRDAAVPPATRGFNYDVVEGKATAARITGAALTLPMMAARRMVLVRDLAQTPADELAKLIGYLDAPSPSTVLVMVTSKLDKRLKLYAAAAKKKWLHVLEAPRNPTQWIRAEAADRGVRIGGDAVARLADAVGNDLSRLALTLDQLALYAGDRPVSVDDVEDLVADTRERTVFELTDAIGEGRLAAALAAVASLSDQRQSAVGVLTMLGRHVRQLSLVHAGRARGLVKGQLAQLVGAPPFVVDKLSQQARRYAPAALARAAALLTTADRALKGMPVDPAAGDAPEGLSGTIQKTLGRQLGERVMLERLVVELIGLGQAGGGRAEVRR
ncbi:MAG: DNA polymerase III subunit delta [Kofleriaceae bacterium]|nr:DNA polymerase III subunit delta [Myxococcales bacterium]MCB9563861.1 DNA polymerase III subunit delta [Kofleriaceae bacterium]MCB9575105.1 DNA polymerase III subunit delta [Kofleriaceae bacterium]